MDRNCDIARSPIRPCVKAVGFRSLWPLDLLQPVALRIRTAVDLIDYRDNMSRPDVGQRLVPMFGAKAFQRARAPLLCLFRVAREHVGDEILRHEPVNAALAVWVGPPDRFRDHGEHRRKATERVMVRELIARHELRRSVLAGQRHELATFDAEGVTQFLLALVSRYDDGVTARTPLTPVYLKDRMQGTGSER